MPDQQLEVLRSFKEAERQDLETRLALSPDERMAFLEELRRNWYGYAQSEPAFPGVLVAFHRIRKRSNVRRRSRSACSANGSRDSPAFAATTCASASPYSRSLISGLSGSYLT